jgi:hypothetical protein
VALSWIRNSIIQVKVSCIFLGRWNISHIALVHIKVCLAISQLDARTSWTWSALYCLTAIWFMTLCTMPSLSYTARRRVIESSCNDTKAARNWFGQRLLFREIESCTFARIIIRTRQGQKFVTNCWLSRHLRFRLKFSYMRPNLGFIITSLKRSDIQCNGYSLEVRDQKNYDLLLLRESNGSQFSDTHREYF